MHTARLYGEMEHKYTRKAFRHAERHLSRAPSTIMTTDGHEHITITTSFSHPIRFNFVPDSLPNDTSVDCHFCTNPFFGLYGLVSDESGQKSVEGFYHDDGSGFQEVKGGWGQEGHEKTRMCVECTSLKLQIMLCDAHEILPIPADQINSKIWDDWEWEKATLGYGNGEKEAREMFETAMYCSICPNVASWKCAREQEEGALGDGTGCGLLLCEECEVLRVKCVNGMREGGNLLGTMVREVKGNEWLWPGGVRADAEFLCEKGELGVRFTKGFGEKIDSGIEVLEDGDIAQQSGGDLGERGNDGIQVIDRKGKGKDWSWFEPQYRPGFIADNLNDKPVRKATMNDLYLSPGDIKAEDTIGGSWMRNLEDVTQVKEKDKPRSSSPSLPFTNTDANIFTTKITRKSSRDIRESNIDNDSGTVDGMEGDRMVGKGKWKWKLPASQDIIDLTGED